MRSQGLTITLIIFIILTITLGVVSYLMGKGYSETAQKLKTAEGQVSSLTTEVTQQKQQIEDLTQKIGYPVAGSAMDVSKILELMDNDVQQIYGDTTSTPRDYKNSLYLLEENNKNLTDQSAQLQKDIDSRQNQIVQLQNELAVTKKDCEKQVADAVAARDKRASEDKVRYDKLETEHIALAKTVEDIKNDATEQIRTARTSEANTTEMANKVADINMQLAKKISDASRITFESADAEVVSTDQATRKIRVNVGSEDGVRPMMTFGVYDKGSLDIAQAHQKADVEIVRILDARTSEARILTDEVANPIMPGDLLWTPLWAPGEHVKYALGPALNVTGNSRGDVELLKNLILNSGAELTAWTDVAGEIHGDLTKDTVYLIVSDQDNTSNMSEKAQVSHTKLIDDAKKFGIQEMKLAKFLRIVGYKSVTQVTDYQGDESPVALGAGKLSPDTSAGYVAPIYSQNKNIAAPVSSGIVAPIYKNAQPSSTAPKNRDYTAPGGGQALQGTAPVSNGIVSPLYDGFRRRNP